MNNYNINFPYKIGTYLSKEEDEVTHIDQLHEYVLDKNGLSVILLLDALTDPRLSSKISINTLVTNWTEVNISNNNVIKRVKSNIK